jgi:asparagine synthase (glutamine-hydrolysing)
MLRYISLAFDQKAPDAAEACQIIERKLMRNSSRWQSVYDQSGLKIFTFNSHLSREQAHRLWDHGGVVLGTAFSQEKKFDSDSVPRFHSFSPHESRQAVSTGGRSLIHLIWGHYVAFIFNEEKSSLCVLRSPMSKLLCFTATFGAVRIFFSRMEDIAELKIIRPSINWAYVGAHLTCGFPPLNEETGLNEVDALEGGECAFLKDHTIQRSFYWNPSDIAKQSVIEKHTFAAAELRRVTQFCVNGWASMHKKILLRLSGGIDSSIVLCCLKLVPTAPEVLSVNCYSPGAMGDERRYARAVAKYASSQLIERERDPCVNFDIFRSVQATARPVLDFSGYENYTTDTRLAEDFGADVIFSGELGDALFEHGVGEAAAADFIWRHGFNPRLFRIAFDAAFLLGFSIWKVLTIAVNDGLRRPVQHWTAYEYLKKYKNARFDTKLIREEIAQNFVRDIRRYSHPWVRDTHGVPPAKFMMMSGFPMETSFEGAFIDRNDAQIAAPLASQPLAELCLRIPTYLSVHKGQDRAIARMAFQTELPKVILNRRAKGTPGLWERQLVQRNSAFVREFLLDGVLRREHILDEGKIDALLLGKQMADLDIGDLIVQIYVEAWLRKWSDTRLRIAA